MSCRGDPARNRQIPKCVTPEAPSVRGAPGHLEGHTVKKPIDESRKVGLDAQMQAGNVAVFIPRLRPRAVPDPASLDPEKTTTAAARPDDDDPGPSAA